MKARECLLLLVLLLPIGIGACDEMKDDGLPFDYGPLQVTTLKQIGEYTYDTVYESRTDYQYDAFGRLFSQTETTYNTETYQFETTSRMDFLYDEFGRLAKRQIFKPVQDSVEMLLFSEYTNHYDAGGKLVMIQGALYDRANKAMLAPSYRWVGTYDDRQRLKASTEETVDSESGNFVTSKIFAFSYDGDGRLVERRDTSPATGNKESSQRYHYTYNDDGALHRETLETYEGDTLTSQSWVENSYRSGKLETLLSNIYDMNKSVWKPSYRRTYSYNDEDRLYQVVIDAYNDSFGNWVSAKRQDLQQVSEGSSRSFEELNLTQPLRYWLLWYFGQGEVNRYSE